MFCHCGFVWCFEIFFIVVVFVYLCMYAFVRTCVLHMRYYMIQNNVLKHNDLWDVMSYNVQEI